MKRRKLYSKDDEQRDLRLQLVCSKASRAVREQVCNVVNEPTPSSSSSSSNSISIADTSHLLVREELELEEGGTVTWEFYHPVKLVQHVLNRCSSLSKIYVEKIEGSASMPWHIQFGCDEHTPGNKLSHDNRRKNMLIMFNFLELGADILECGASWFVPVVVRASLFKGVRGGWSTLLRIFFRHLLLGPLSFTHGGVLVSCRVASDKCYQLQAKLGTCLTDGEGLAKCMQWNGHASMRLSHFEIVPTPKFDIC